MALRIVEVIASEGNSETIEAAAEKMGAVRYWRVATPEPGLAVIHVLLRTSAVQGLLDLLRSALGADPLKARAILSSVLATVPEVEDGPDVPDNGTKSAAASREELYGAISKGVRVDSTFVVLVLLSTIVAAIGLLRDNLAVIIGAMVIAPLLSPILAFAFAIALGDRQLMARATATAASGLMLTIGASALAGGVLPLKSISHELLQRTSLSYDSIALALASGAAAVLSFTSGISSALVGVMVAVALLPPAATFGLMLGSGNFVRAAGAATLLAVNLVCVVLAAQIVFVVQGIKPRTWWQKKDAQQSMTLSIVLSGLLLLVLSVLIYFEEIPH